MEFASAVYGGYFGAAIGILLIASMAIAGQEDMQSVNAQRNFLVVFINGIAAVLFILRGTVDWPVAFILMGGAIIGGYCGARRRAAFAQSLAAPGRYGRRSVLLAVLFREGLRLTCMSC